MKRALLLSIALLFGAVLAVGTENSPDKEASLHYSINADGVVIEPILSVYVTWDATGEVILNESPEVIYQDVVMLVETNPPINAVENVLKSNFSTKIPGELSGNPLDQLQRFRQNQYSDRV